MKIIFIIILYRCTLDESSTIRSIIENINSLDKEWEFLFYDNSPSTNQSIDPVLNIHHHYYGAKENGGILAGYNAGLELAKKNLADWIVLLDQDTILNKNYFVELKKSAEYSNLETVALAPKVTSGGNHPISPLIGRYFRRPLEKTGTYKGKYISLINSGIALRVSYIDSIGGFHKKLWLDGLDHWLSYKIFDTKKEITVFSSTLTHDLSLLSQHKISDFRIKNIYLAERILFHETMNKPQKALYITRLFARYFRSYFRTEEKDTRTFVIQQISHLL